MKAFYARISPLLLVMSLHANEHYLLPEQKSDLLHTLKMKIQRAENFTIITSDLKNRSLQNSIEKSLNADKKFRLITSNLESASFYAKYRKTDVKVPASDRISENFALNILLIDESDVCFSTLPFSDSTLQSMIGEVICTTDGEEITFAKEIERRFMHRFVDYTRK